MSKRETTLYWAQSVTEPATDPSSTTRTQPVPAAWANPSSGSGTISTTIRRTAPVASRWPSGLPQKPDVDKNQQDEIAVLRYEQYIAGPEGGAEFRRRYMVTPVEVKSANGKRVVATVNDDEGVTARTMDQLAGMRAVFPDGTVSGGTQTFAGRRQLRNGRLQCGDRCAVR